MSATSDAARRISAAVMADDRARSTWDSLTPAERKAYVRWVARGWTGSSRKARAEELRSALYGGRKGLEQWARTPLPMASQYL